MSDHPNQNAIIKLPTPNLDGSFLDPNASFKCDIMDNVDEALEQSMELPAFEMSSPISSIGSNCSSPERTLEPLPIIDNINDDSSDYISLEDLKSQISPPDESTPGFERSKKALETIFEDLYLETPPGTPTIPRKQRRRKVRTDLSQLDEFKENVQNMNPQWCTTTH